MDAPTAGPGPVPGADDNKKSDRPAVQQKGLQGFTKFSTNLKKRNCFDFRKGSCHRGNACRFLHTEVVATETMATAVANDDGTRCITDMVAHARQFFSLLKLIPLPPAELEDLLPIAGIQPHSLSEWHLPVKSTVLPLVQQLKDGDTIGFLQQVMKIGIDHMYSGKTALMIASRLGHVDAVNCLLLRSALVNLTNHRNSALHFACLQGHYECVMLPLQHGAVYNCLNHHSLTPLMSAAQLGNRRIVAALLALDQDLLVHSSIRCTASDYAATSGHTALAQELRILETASRSAQQINANANCCGLSLGERPRVCPLCSLRLRPNMYAERMQQQQRHNPEVNPYVAAFLASSALALMLQHPEGLYHMLLDDRSLRKEASESWAICLQV